MGGGSSRVNTVGKPVVVIVGGGFAGTAVAKALDRDFFVVLIDRKDHLVHQIGLPRAIVEPSAARSMHVSYQRLLTNGVVVQAYVTSITPTELHLHGLSSPLTGFDYLVIATGSAYNLPSRIGPTSATVKLPQFDRVNAALLPAHRILVIGAGPVGTEIAGEVATDHPDKEVTLVSSHDFLGTPGLDSKFYATLDNKLKQLRVTVIKGTRVVIPEEVSTALADTDSLYLNERRVWRLSNGQEVEADLTFFCVGSVLNTSAVAASFAAAQGTRGDLSTNEWLQVKGFTNIFAVGDVNGLEKRKLAFIAGEQGKWLGKHLPTIHRQSGEMTGLKPWQAPPPALVLALGRKAGVGQFGKNQLPGWLVTMVKSKDMMVGRTRGELKVKKGEGVLAVTGEVKQERVDKLVQAMKLSKEDATKLVEGLEGPALKALPARDHL